MTQQNASDPAGPASDSQARSIYTALGGSRAIIDSGLPMLVFVPTFLLTRLTYALVGAVGVGALIVVVRMLRRERFEHAIAGFIVIGVAAIFASRTGQAEDFFVPKLLIDVGYGLVYLVSILVRWPVLGVVLGPLLGENFAWRQDPPRLRAYSVACWFWVGLFVSRLAVQVPLYLSDQAVALGIAHLAMSWPLFLVVVWLTWLALRGVPLATPSGGVETPSFLAGSESSSNSTESEESRGSHGQQPHDNTYPSGADPTAERDTS